MIVFGAIITIIGLFLTVKIRQQEYNATYDCLTKLKNRHSLLDYVKEKSPTDFSVFFIDLNKFKLVNDTYGHEVGDEILISVAERLGLVFGTETLYRYGGMNL
jgi:diguanylate cyclase (GGDEF)-like protein